MFVKIFTQIKFVDPNYTLVFMSIPMIHLHSVTGSITNCSSLSFCELKKNDVNFCEFVLEAFLVAI